MDRRARSKHTNHLHLECRTLPPPPLLSHTPSPPPPLRSHTLSPSPPPPLLQVHIHRLIACSTIEERVLGIQASKLQQADEVCLPRPLKSLLVSDPQQVLSGAGRGGKMQQLSMLRLLLQ